MHKPLGLNEKQQNLAQKLTTGYFAREEHPVYHKVKTMLLESKNIPRNGRIINERYDTVTQLLQIDEIDLKTAKVTPTFCRDRFGLVPKQMTSYAKFVKEVEDYQTYSVMLSYDITQGTKGHINRYSSINHKVDANHTDRINKATGVIWLTFYDNDTKLVMYDFYPKTIYDNTIQYVPKVSAAYINPSKNNPKRINLRTIPMNRLSATYSAERPYFLDLDHIEERRYSVINNLHSNIVSTFNEALV